MDRLEVFILQKNDWDRLEGISSLQRNVWDKLKDLQPSEVHLE